MDRKTKIVCTLGPSSDSPEMIKKLIASGMDIARINFSHGNYEEHSRVIRNIREASEETGKNIAIMLDTKGPEIRTGDLKEPTAFLRKNNRIILTSKEVIGDENRISIDCACLFREIDVEDKILLDDGLISLKVLEKKDEEILCLIENDGLIKNKRGVNVPGKYLSMPFLSKKDISDIKFALEHELDYIALSFVREDKDVEEVRELFKDKKDKPGLIAKIENIFAVKNIQKIIKVSDGVMVARGDLGVEIPFEEMPAVQKKIIAMCREKAKPVITATQMLDSMIRNPRPTRAEVTDVANSILDGTDAVMLSGETAMGSYPVESCETMAKIAFETEKILHSDVDKFKGRPLDKDYLTTDNICKSAVILAEQLKAKAIIVPTCSGFTARMVSKNRSIKPVIAAVWDDKVRNKLALVWGVKTLMIDHPEDTDNMILKSLEAAKAKGHIDEGDLVIITAGIPCAVVGKTNMIKVHVV